jgi:hypothetical protein
MKISKMIAGVVGLFRAPVRVAQVVHRNAITEDPYSPVPDHTPTLTDRQALRHAKRLRRAQIRAKHRTGNRVQRRAAMQTTT